MQTDNRNPTTGKRAAATGSPRDSLVAPPVMKNGRREASCDTINIPRDEWNALKKRVSDIEALLDRQTHGTAMGLPRADWESAQAESMVDAAKAATILSLSNPNQVRSRVRALKLFGVIPPGRERGMSFPVWQFDRNVVGEPLRQALSALAAIDLQGWAVHEFFEEPRVALEGLSARQVLTGTADSGGYAPSAHLLLNAAPQERLARVLAAIEEYPRDS